MAAALIGVGVGPGDPELLTLRALRVLRQADRVFAPVSDPEVEGRAESVVRRAAPEVEVERLAFVMARQGADRDAGIAAAGRLVEHLDAGERVAFVTLGDPNLYSTVSSVVATVRALRPAVPVETVPGIMAFQDLAARAGTVVADGAEVLTVVTGLDGTAAFDDALADPTAGVVVYKGGHHLPELADRLRRAGRLDGAVVGELLGLDGERVCPVAERAGERASYLATVVVPPYRAGPGPA
jgi:precorrin-2/cobalt-factor-2 C20-methyltransferase